MFEALRDRLDDFIAWGRSTEPWKFVLATAAIVAGLLLAVPIMIAALPIVLLVVLAAGLVMFVELWIKEFRILMDLDDDVFKGRNDKLIWAILLIVAPPLGVGVFRSYRKLRWPEAKPAGNGPVVDLH